MLEEPGGQLPEGAPGAADAEGPERREERPARDSRRHRRGRGVAVRRGALPDVQRASPRRCGWKVEIMEEHESEVGGYKEIIAMIEGTARLFEAEVRKRRAPRAARAGDRGAGPRPHVGGHGGRAARSRRRRSRGRPERHPHRYVLLFRAGRPIGQHDLLRRPHHAPADGRWSFPARTRSRRSRTAPRLCASSARACTTSPCRSSRSRLRRTVAARSVPATAARRSGPTTSRRTA